MPAVDESKNILDIDAAHFYQLKSLLDENNAWQSFLEVLPPFYCSNKLERLAKEEGQKQNTTPAKELLIYLGSQNVTVQMMICWLEEMQHIKALMILKKYEPVRIIQQPEQYIRIQEGYHEISLVCSAVGFPAPSYQWFKDDIELLLEQEPVLLISSLSMEDGGIYICRVHNRNPQNGAPCCIFSEPVLVSVIPQQYNISIQHNQMKPSFTSQTQHEAISPDSHGAVFNCSETTNISIQDKKPIKCIPDGKLQSAIKIVKQPRSPGKVAQGCSVILEFKCESVLPIKYQWYYNGREIIGETSSELKLKDLRPDPQTDEVIWYYLCEAENKCDRVVSHSVSIELDVADELIPYFAEDKIALLIANDTYDNLEDLGRPADDVTTLSTLLQSLDFQVFVLRNLNLTEMTNAIHIFCRNLRKDVYGLFYYAGHGFEQYGQSYLQPVDCSADCHTYESICTEYILECMQERETALNVMLIDTCRKLPNCKDMKNPTPGKIFKPKVKRNTVYGYATSFLYGSHECDIEQNGFFVKHLKKYITQKRRIQDILWLVQKDFETDPLTSRIQYPWIASSLSSSRSLADKVIGQNILFIEESVLWSDVTTLQYEDKRFRIKELGVTIALEFRLHNGIFCNGIDVCIFLEAEETASPSVISQIEIVLQFKPGIKTKTLVPSDSSLVFKSRELQCIVQVFDMQKTEGPLEATLCINHRPTGQTAHMVPMSFQQPAISLLKLSKENLQLSNDQKNYSSQFLSESCTVYNDETNIENCNTSEDEYSSLESSQSSV